MLKDHCLVLNLYNLEAKFYDCAAMDEKIFLLVRFNKFFGWSA